jgi:xanthosine utilization system XapX-like protein
MAVGMCHALIRVCLHVVPVLALLRLGLLGIDGSRLQILPSALDVHRYRTRSVSLCAAWKRRIDYGNVRRTRASGCIILLMFCPVASAHLIADPR